MNVESILKKSLNKRQKAVLTRIADRQAAGDDSGIDYSDIPQLTDQQLASARTPPKKLVAVRLDQDVSVVGTILVASVRPQ